MSLTTNKSILSWIEEKVELVKPDKIVWIDGSKEQIDALRAEACSTGEMEKLNEELLPECYLHRTHPTDEDVRLRSYRVQLFPRGQRTLLHRLRYAPPLP